MTRGVRLLEVVVQSVQSESQPAAGCATQPMISRKMGRLIFIPMLLAERCRLWAGDKAGGRFVLCALIENGRFAAMIQCSTSWPGIIAVKPSLSKRDVRYGAAVAGAFFIVFESAVRAVFASQDDRRWGGRCRCRRVFVRALVPSCSARISASFPAVLSRANRVP